MKKTINNNLTLKLIQSKIFNFLQSHISGDNTLRKLSTILEKIDFSNFCKYFLTNIKF